MAFRSCSFRQWMAPRAKALLADLSVDQDHRGILTQPVENNVFPVGRNVKCAHGRVFRETGQSPHIHRRKIQQPEILPGSGFRCGHENQAVAIRKESQPLSIPLRADFGHFDGSSIRAKGQQRLLRKDVRPGVRDQRPVRRPHWISSHLAGEADRFTTGYRNPE
jgi:hypothetical protein